MAHTQQPQQGHVHVHQLAHLGVQGPLVGGVRPRTFRPYCPDERGADAIYRLQDGVDDEGQPVPKDPNAWWPKTGK